MLLVGKWGRIVEAPGNGLSTTIASAILQKYFPHSSGARNVAETQSGGVSA